MHNPVTTNLPQTRLQSRVRRFWFNNVPGTLNVDGYTVTRQDIDIYGGPNPRLTDPISQQMEWLSRVRQTNLFRPHNSRQVEQCRILCERQGSELWTHYHQNFDFTFGCDSDIRAPKCLCIMPLYALKIGPNSPFLSFQNPHCHHLNLVLRRRLARSCQIELSPSCLGRDLSKYDFILTINPGESLSFKKTKTPVILYCHDMWPDDQGFQQVLDEYQPDILLTPYPSPWRENFITTAGTQLIFAPFAPSMFFTRPNLDPHEKPIDLLVIGAVSGPIYVPRISLTAQISALNRNYKIEYSHLRGGSGVCWDGQTLRQRPKGPIRYLNQWSRYLSSARYVIFGRLKSEIHQFVLGKYYETLGSGAVPIFPEVPDLKLLGISPFEHYIPLSEVESRNDRLAHLLDHYEDYSYIARNAVAWSVANMDRMLFDDFETMIYNLTEKRYPKRLIS